MSVDFAVDSLSASALKFLGEATPIGYHRTITLARWQVKILY
jgi:hypothetical protein